MTANKRKASGILLILGMVLLVLGITSDNTLFTWLAIFLILASLILGGRWMRKRR